MDALGSAQMAMSEVSKEVASKGYVEATFPWMSLLRQPDFFVEPQHLRGRDDNAPLRLVVINLRSQSARRSCEFGCVSHQMNGEAS